LELEATEKQQNETLQEASLEAKKTVATAQEQAKSYIEAQKEEARKQAEEIVEKARSAMDLERQRVLNDAREEIASLVILTTSKVLQRELGDEEKSRFSESAAKEISLSN
jgi:F-type H+-transporting ATPase subunit b